MPFFYIKTYGCQMNVADSEKLAGVLQTAGYQATEDPWQTNIILINTCVVRQTAEDKAAWYITSAKGYKNERPGTKIILCGCFVSEPGRDVRKQFPHVDLFIEPNQPEKLAEFLGTPNSELRTRNLGRSAWVTIMRGCDNFCSYCIVPYVRGREHSRPIGEILAEIKQIDLNKYEELFLLGQNVNSYQPNFADLLRQINAHIARYSLPVTVKFMTSHPRDMSDEIINTICELPHVAKEFYMPIQHGDDEILKSMNRGYTVDYYRQLVKKIRLKMPAAKILTDMIVGYPGETEIQFQNTLNLIKEIKFNEVRMAAFSPRPQTAAAKLPNQLPDDIKQARLQQIIQVVRQVVKC